MISIPQCRAARGLLNWTQQDLANTSGLSKTAINNFEKGNSDIKSESLRAIKNAFKNAEIEFTDHDGLHRKQETNTILSGPYALTELLHNIMENLDNNDEILFLNADARNPSPEEKNQAAMYIQDIERKQSNKRILCETGATSPYGSLDQTQHLDNKTLQMMNSCIIYGNKVATLQWHSDTINIIESEEISSSERARFEACWIQSTAPTSEAQKLSKYS